MENSIKVIKLNIPTRHLYPAMRYRNECRHHLPFVGIRYVAMAIAVLCLSFTAGLAVADNQVPDTSKSIVISPLEFMEQKDQGWVVVDVRHQKEFAQFRLQGSLNIPLYELKTKTFFKTKNVVLVNARNHHLLLDTAGQLHQAGFTQIKVLRGGLRGWQEQGGALEGDFFKARTLDELSARDFQLFKAFGDWMILLLSRKPDAPEPVFDAGAKVHRIKDITDLKQLVELEPESAGKEDWYILIATEDGQGYRKIRKALDKIKGHTLYYLEGGVQGYAEYVQMQAELHDPQQKKQERCGTCP